MDYPNLNDFDDFYLGRLGDLVSIEFAVNAATKEAEYWNFPFCYYSPKCSPTLNQITDIAIKNTKKLRGEL